MSPAEALPRPEHPRPDLQRASWLNLNGWWTFTLDPGKSGHEQGWAKSQGFDRPIRVPFCPESALSGVAHTDFIEAMWYHRRLTVPAAWASQRVLLHFGAVDFACEVYLDGHLLGRHVGGSSSFCFDLGALARPGSDQHLVLAVRDEVRSGLQTGGKQSHRFGSFGCHYTRVTGIWQTVWLEAVAPGGLRDLQVLPDLAGARLHLVPRYHASSAACQLRARARADGTVVGECTAPARNGLPLVLALSQVRPWSPADPFLYDLELTLLDAAGRELETMQSYAGLREVTVQGDQVLLNGQPLYQRLVLDQGFYPDGIWTAPSDAALRQDIELSLAAGFNGARLHQKVFEPRFHYWADRLGYLTWGESASWGLDVKNPLAARNFLSEWAEVLQRDRNHPSIIAWTPFNETRDTGDGVQHARLHRDAYDLCLALDPTRPVNDASGYVHVQTDLWTVHNYEQDPAKLQAQLTPHPETGVFRNYPDREVPYTGQPYLVDEFGGIKWIPPTQQPHAANSWGYGTGPKTLEEFYERLAGQVAALRALPHVRGFCYTQLTDVEQEQNGIYGYDRSVKFDLARVKAIFQS